VNYYQEENYNVWDYTNDRGEEERTINIIAKKNREIILIHCHIKTDNITLEEVQKFEKQRDKFIDENPIFSEYDIKLRYTLKGFHFTEEAFWYIQEHAKFISYGIVK
jgi:hypothetical protein